MGKKKSKKPELHDYYLRSGKVGKLMKRYGVEGVHSGHPDGRTGKPNRRPEDVDRDIAAAMMADPNTVMQFQYGADVSKDAKRFAKKGIEGKNIYDAYGTLKDLKKEYVGGGGMDGAENIMGLTYELKKASREAFAAELAEREPKMSITDEPDEPDYVENPYADQPEGLDPFVRETRDRVDEWIADGTGRTGRGYAGVFPLARYDGQKGAPVPSPGQENLDATEERLISGPTFASNFKRQIMNEIRQAAGYGDDYV